MEIPDQLQQVGIGLAKHRFVAVLEEMAMAIVPAIEVTCIAGQQSFHDRGNRQGSGP
jgi:hypothetical protein